MPTLKTSGFKELVLGPTRTCPECEEPELEISGINQDIFECNNCGAIWQRIIPFKTESGKMTKLPAKLKELLKNGKL